MAESKESAATVERYCRVNITRNTKSFTYETTCSLRWSDDRDGADDLKYLLADADEVARNEIARRQRMDDLEGAS